MTSYVGYGILQLTAEEKYNKIGVRKRTNIRKRMFERTDKGDRYGKGREAESAGRGAGTD